jgi:hypothetical protein
LIALKSQGQLLAQVYRNRARPLFGNGLEKRRHDYLTAIAELDDEYGEVLKKSPLLAGFDIENPEQAEAIFNKLNADQSAPAWWVYVSSSFLSIAKDAIEKQDAPPAA